MPALVQLKILLRGMARKLHSHYRIGVDIGGTKIIFVLLRGHKILKTNKIFTPQVKEKLIRALTDNIQKLASKNKLKGIGIGVPGPLNKKGDLILNPPNLKCLWRTPLASIIQRETGIQTKMGNDVNCFTLAEALLRAGRGAKTVFGITLGTGVGGGAVINGELFTGAFGSAGEVGHMTIKFDGPRCSCGSRGCLEEYCSERFFKKRGTSPEKAYKLAKSGDKQAKSLYNEYGKYLGIGLGNVINLLDPEVIVIGGGIAAAGRFFLKQAKKEIKKTVISPLAEKGVKIKRAKLGELAGAIGAALL